MSARCLLRHAALQTKRNTNHSNATLMSHQWTLTTYNTAASGIGNTQTIKTPAKTSTKRTNNFDHLVSYAEKLATWPKIAGTIRMYDPHAVVVVVAAVVGTSHHLAAGNEALDLPCHTTDPSYTKQLRTLR